MSLFLQIDPNPNCEPLDGMLFQPRTEPRAVGQVRYERNGEAIWCDVTGVEENGRWGPVAASRIDDSGDGSCYLIYGGAWGMRLRDSARPEPWDLGAAAQWGVPYLVVGGDGADLRFL